MGQDDACLKQGLESGHACFGVPAMQLLNGALEVVCWDLSVAANQTLQNGIVDEQILLLQMQQTCNKHATLISSDAINMQQTPVH